ncbi:MAG: aspartate aminotransferase family protein [Chitinophagales bacterium]
MLSQRQLFLHHIAQTSDSPLALEITHADGCWLYDIAGKKYLDLISGIAVSNLGHNHPEIKKAITEQLDKYTHLMVYGEFVETPQVQLAKQLTDLLPQNLSSVYLTNSGSEAIECAIKLAKKYTGRTEIISFKNSYHGSTLGALSLGNNEERKNAFRPLIPDNHILEYNNFEQLKHITTKTAAVIIEPVQAEAGVILPVENYLTTIRKRCDETKTLLIFDECQTGFGRTGKLFAFEKYNVTPDVLCLGKAIGGGMPLGACISSKTIMQSLTNNPVLGHITTFGGHAVCCAAGLASLKVLIGENIIPIIDEKSRLFLALLNHQRIKAVRNEGFLMAVEFENAEINLSVNKKLIQYGILVDWFLFAPECLRIAPPLIISEEEITFACEKIIETLNSFS